jgi:tRNA-specific 2-thiouridylase
VKVLAALSGGVDSSVMAALLQGEGHEVVGLTMSLLEGTVATAAAEGATAAQREAADARALCANLGIEHHVANMADTFRSQVVERFCRVYLDGRTPNPCIDCNRHLKLAALQQQRRTLGLDAVATGHYARVGFDEVRGRWVLRRALDEAKDQSYVLFRATQDDLAHLLLPLGELTKSQVRALAQERGFACASKPDSQDICFVPDGDYVAFIERYSAACDAGAYDGGALGDGRPETLAEGVGAASIDGEFDLSTLKPGPIVDNDGKLLGTHQGIARYTLGQRKGIGVAAPQALYVCGKDAKSNTLTVGPLDEALVTRVTAHDVSMVDATALEGPTRVMAKTHYRHVPQPATATQPDADTLVIEFDEPQRPAAPGQALVVYDDDVLLAGGTIA